jgi:hypothetical protein
MSQRWLQRDFMRCMSCSSVQRTVRGYKPIPNPILYDPDEQARSYHREVDTAVHRTSDSRLCSSCNKMHGRWEWVDFQTFIDEKAAKADP